jgi:hypothetical protein
MLSYAQVKGKAIQFRSLVGMSVEEFELLHNYYEPQWSTYITHFIVSGTPRLRPHRIRKDGKLENSRDQLLFILHYLKGNSLQEHHAAAYQMNQPQANLWIHLLLALLKKTLKGMGELPERRTGKLKALLEGMEQVFIDGTERDIQRPWDEQEQKAHYSGKKKHIK